MRIGWLLPIALAMGCTAHGGNEARAEGRTRQQVVVELFSSEGCSSCPAADAVLSDLASKQPISGAEVLALELHVDYWNDLGWTDPFSSPAFSARQRAYAEAMRRRGIYTPQMVIDGDEERVGSQREAATAAIAMAAKRPKASVALYRRGDAVSVVASALPEPNEPADIWLAITESGLRTAVPRGENAGSVLAHGPVVRRLERIATGAGPRLAAEAQVHFDASWRRENVRLVAFVQRKRDLRIVGAGAVAYGG